MRDILVHLDGSSFCQARIDTAIAVARRFGDARLLGLFAQCLPDAPSLAWPPPSRSLADIARDSAAQFRASLDGTGIPFAWRRRMCSRLTQLLDEVAATARMFDLTVLSPDDLSKETQTLPEHFAEQVVLQSGRPILVVPHNAPLSTVGDRVLIAWNGGREAARAVADAMPLLRTARKVQITVSGPYQQRHFDGSAALDRQDLLDHLDSHGISAEADHLGDEPEVVELLLSRAAELGSDLLVMGAHGNYGFPHLKRGTATRQVLSQLTLPLLMAY